MLILTLINVQYLQKVVFSSEKHLNGQNPSSSGSVHPIKKSPPVKYLIPPIGGIPQPYCFLENPGLYCTKASSDLTEPQLYFLINNVYKTNKTFYFSETDQHFVFVWFQKFPWLCYSCWNDGAYYLYCVLSSHKSTSNSRIVNFYSQRYRKWSVAVCSFRKHVNAK